MERINPYWDHRSEVTVRNNGLVIMKKSNWKIDNELVDLYEQKAKDIIAKKTIPQNPFAFHTRFYWEDSIPYEIVNNDIDSSWDSPDFLSTTSVSMSLRPLLGRIFLSIIRKLLSQNRRNAELKLESLLICPSCKSSNIRFSNTAITCDDCSAYYENSNGLPALFSKK